MSLGRITVWSSGQVLTAAALNGEFNNILNNALQLISPLTGNLNVNNDQLLNARIENRTSDPGAGNVGRIFFNLTFNEAKVDVGSVNLPLTNQGWQRVTGLIGGVTSSDSSVTLAARSYVTQTTDHFSVYQTVATSPLVCFVSSADGGPGFGPGGRDQTSTFAPGAVHIYAITTGMLSTAPALIASHTAPPGFPTMTTSASYNSATYLGSYMFAAGGIFQKGFQTGSEFFYQPAINLAQTTSGLLGAVVRVSATAYVPDNAQSFDTLVAFSTVGFHGATDPRLNIYYNTSEGTDVGAAQGVSIPAFASGGIMSIPLSSGDAAFAWALQVNTTRIVAQKADVVSYRVANGDA